MDKLEIELSNAIYNIILEVFGRFPYHCIENSLDVKKIIDRIKIDFVKIYKFKYKKMNVIMFKNLDIIFNKMFRKYLTEIHLKKWFVLSP